MASANALFRAFQAMKIDEVPRGFLDYAQALMRGERVTWLDFETTGRNIYEGAIPTEVAAMTIHPSGKVEHWSTVLQTEGRPVSAEGWKTAAKYGQITREMMDEGATYQQAAQKLKSMIGEGMVAGQNIKPFDMPFAEQLFARAGIEAPAAITDERLQFDLLEALYAKHGKGQSQAMAAVERRLGIINPAAHQALGDVWTEMAAAHTEMGLPFADIPKEVYARATGKTVTPSAAAAVVDQNVDEVMEAFLRPSEKTMLKHTGGQIGTELQGFGKTLMAAARKHPVVAAGVAALGGAWLVQQMRDSRRRPTYNMQATPAQMNRAYHENRVYV